MSKKIFSAQEWENAPSKKDSPDKSSPISSYSSSSDVQSRVEEIISEIESRGLDIAPSYDEWVKQGFALGSEFKEMGREYFHRLSALHPGYEFNATDKQYNNCLNSKGSGITLSTFFYLASKVGIELFKYQKSILPNIQNGNLENWIADSCSANIISQTVLRFLLLISEQGTMSM